MGSDKVFISYSHDSDAHSERVLALANALIQKGLQVGLDQFETRPKRGWAHWCEEQLRPNNARFVLVICTPTYRKRVEDKVARDEGRGTFWEGALIYQYLYEEKGNERFIPVLLDNAPERGVPAPLKPHQYYRIKALEKSDPGFEALYRELTHQPAVIPPARGEIEVMPPRDVTSQPTEEAPTCSRGRRPRQPRSAPAATVAHPVDIARIDKYAPAELFGRKAETAVIDAAWAKAVAGEAHPNVLTFVALGGEGKTALVAQWAIGRVAASPPEFDSAFAWSFYSQGTREQAGASPDLFLAAALNFFGGEAKEGESGHDKGKRLAALIGERRALLILDGLEPLQYAPSSPLAGQLKDDGVLALLKGFAQRNAGLCLVTTRYVIKQLLGWKETAPQRDLAPLSDEAGAKLLASLGVKGTGKERQKLSAEVKGHALTLNLIGSYLRLAFKGDIRKVDRVELAKANTQVQNGHAFHVLDAYVRWFESDPADGPRALAALRLLGLFDRPADAGCLEALWREPAIPGLTEPLVGLGDEEREIVLKRLADAKLITIANDASGALENLDAHPLLREYFAKHLRETRPESWRAAHKRLYEHLTATTEDKPTPTLDDLQPLYEAVAHGCAAGMYEEACAAVYRDRILRGGGADGFYTWRKLGAFGADLGAVAGFFDQPWRRVSPHLSPPDQAWLLNQAAISLRALGRLAEAREALRAGLEMAVAQEDWRNAAIGAGNLSELELSLGEVGAAARYGEAGIAHADRSGDAFQGTGNRTTLADALHQAGRRAEAEARFVEAEAIQAEFQPEYPRLYALPGFRYCDLLLAEAERAAWRRFAKLNANPERFLAQCGGVEDRGRKMFEWRVPSDALLDIGHDHLTLARAALYAAMLRGEAPRADHVDAAVDFLRRAGQQDHFPRALLTRALWRCVAGDFAGGREDLDEAFEIAERGPMQLHLADIHLHRARLFGLFPGRPAAYPWSSAAADLAAARELIETCGYHRRLGELEDAEAALALP
ncbi:MAG: SEFIR domain-containing protein [Roseiarcus sp.]